MRRRVELLAWLGARLGKPPGMERLARWVAPIDKRARLPEICLVRDGMLFVTRPGVPIGWHIAFFGSYEPDLRKIMRAVLPPGGAAVDIGANIGWHTLLMAGLVGPQGRVLAIEANPSVCDELAKNVRINRLANVDIVPHAAGEREEQLSFMCSRADDPDAGNGYIQPGTDVSGAISVQARPLDAIVSESGLARLDLIKIDVEGFEWPVLCGGEQTIAKFRPYVIFEFDAAYASRGGGSAALLRDFFARYNYRLYASGRNWAARVELSTWPDCANIVAIPRE
jgi:FkbM family methyltransferase